MKLGLCTGQENLEMAMRLGFDYIECTVSSTEAMNDRDFLDLKSKVKNSSIKIERFNVLFPRTICLIGPEADHEKIRNYLEKSFQRVSELGGTTVVFGSGRSRTFPSGMAYRDAFLELIKVTRLIGEIAAKHGIIIAIEPLNSGESNCINSVREGAMLEAAVDLPSVGLLADNYHMLMDNEPMNSLLEIKKLNHIHISLANRYFPVVYDNDVKSFIDVLKQIGYSGTMSIEGKTDDLENDAAAALKVLRSAVS